MTAPAHGWAAGSTEISRLDPADRGDPAHGDSPGDRNSIVSLGHRPESAACVESPTSPSRVDLEISRPPSPHAPARRDPWTRPALRDASLGVVIPTLDEAVLLPRLLERLLDPTRLYDPLDRADRVFVADGDSRDATREIARERGATVVRASPSRGVQLATGAHALDTDVLLFLHADSLPRRGALARVRETFRDRAVVATAMRQEIESEGRFYRCVERCANLRSKCGLVYGDCGLAVRRAVYDEIGGFGPFEIFEDVDLALRLRRAGKIRVLDGATLAISARRWQAEGALRCTLRNWMLCARFFLGADPRELARRYRSHPGSAS